MPSDSDSDSLATFQPNVSSNLNRHGEQHFQHDLNDHDRQTILTAFSQIRTYASIGSLLGLGLGIFLNVRMRLRRRQILHHFRLRTMENSKPPPPPPLQQQQQKQASENLQPVAIKSANGNESAGGSSSSISWWRVGTETAMRTGTETETALLLPPFLRTTTTTTMTTRRRLGDFMTYTIFSIVGVILGGQIGLVSGAMAARRTFEREDPGVKRKVERAFIGYRLDAMRRQIENLERKEREEEEEEAALDDGGDGGDGEEGDGGDVGVRWGWGS